MELFNVLHKVREVNPLVQCITNFVTVNDCANILLAAGASPTMSMNIREVEETVQRASALVCNMGAIEHVDSMIIAGEKANEIRIPVVLDPVAAGGSVFRGECFDKLFNEVHFNVIRGNASEIMALANKNGKPSGVDVNEADVITQDNLYQSIDMIKKLAEQSDSVIAVSGAIDIISDGVRTAIIHNGCPTMARITGSGCMLTTLIGAFCSVAEPFEATCSAMAVMGIAGEIAEKRRIENGTGNATFRNDLIDAVFNMDEDTFKEKLKYEIYKG